MTFLEAFMWANGLLVAGLILWGLSEWGKWLWNHYQKTMEAILGFIILELLMTLFIWGAGS